MKYSFWSFCLTFNIDFNYKLKSILKLIDVSCQSNWEPIQDFNCRDETESHEKSKQSSHLWDVPSQSHFLLPAKLKGSIALKKECCHGNIFFISIVTFVEFAPSFVRFLIGRHKNLFSWCPFVCKEPHIWSAF